MDIAVGAWHTLGIKSDGTVVACGDNEYGQCKVSSWSDIVSVDGGNWFSVGLKSNGRVVYAGGADSGDRDLLNETKEWKDVVSLTCADDCSVYGIKADGSLLKILSFGFASGPYAAVVNTPWQNKTTVLRTNGTVSSRYEKMDGVRLRLPVQRAVTGASATVSAPADTGIWLVRPFVDEFDLPTDEYYIVNGTPFTGKFSNSATTGSELRAYLFCEKTKSYDYGLSEYIEIRLYEYGQYRVSNGFSTTREYDVAIMNNAGEKFYLSGEMWPGSYDLTISGDDAQTIIQALRQGGIVRFSISEARNGLSKYIFTAENATGFDAAYEEWWTK